jgi:hypothetical protein
MELGDHSFKYGQRQVKERQRDVRTGVARRRLWHPSNSRSEEEGGDGKRSHSIDDHKHIIEYRVKRYNGSVKFV